MVFSAMLLVAWQLGGQTEERSTEEQAEPTQKAAPEIQQSTGPADTETEEKPQPETQAVQTEPAPPPVVRPAPPKPRPIRRQTAPLLFGTTRTAHADLTPFPQWTGSLERYYRGRSQVIGACRATAFNGCHMQRWKAMLAEVSSETRQRQLNLVNRYMNKHRYIVDPINWGVTEYWAVPQEFLRKFGDCEDYAIAKYLSLRALGWSADDLQIVVLQDMNLRIMHAILIVKFEGKNMLLDNQITRVIDANKVHHYKPIYSLNENGWWRHSRARRARR